MPDFISQDEITARTDRAVDAATAAGRELGLEITEPRVLHDAFSVVVHLAPAPVVARVPVVLPPGDTLEAVSRRQRAELDVAGWLADQGHPVVPPSPLVPREPAQRDGRSMTFWQHVEQDDGEPDWTHRTARTADLHAALRDYPGELPFLTRKVMTIPQVSGILEDRHDLVDPADLERAEREWAILEPLVGTRAKFETAFPGATLQPVHGDAPAVNIISTSAGELHSDFEVVALGPAEWDLPMIDADGATAYNAAAARHGLRSIDNDAHSATTALGMLQGVACLALAPQLPMLVDGVKPLLDAWREAPLAGGFA